MGQTLLLKWYDTVLLVIAKDFKCFRIAYDIPKGYGIVAKNIAKSPNLSIEFAIVIVDYIHSKRLTIFINTKFASSQNAKYNIYKICLNDNFFYLSFHFSLVFNL